MEIKRINFDKTVKMHEACADDDLRPAMQCVYFENGYAYASNGIIVVRNKVAEICNLDDEQQGLLNGKMLHKNHYKDILSYDFIEVSEDGIECKHTKTGRVSFFYFYDKTKYPNVDSVISSVDVLPNTPLEKIGLDGNNLKKLCDSMFEGRSVFFSFKGADKGIVVRSLMYSNSVALMMPRIIDTV